MVTNSTATTVEKPCKSDKCVCYNSDMANKNPYRQEIIDLVSGNPGQFSYRDVAEKFNIDREKVRNVARNNGLSGFFCKHTPRGKMGIDSTFIGESAMKAATQADLNALRVHCEEHNLPYDARRLWWHKTKEFSVSFYDEKQVADAQKAQDEFLARIQRAAPRTKKQPLPTKNLAVFGNFDVHIGKHCELMRTGHDYTPDKAVSQVLEGQDALYQMVKPHGVSDILFPMGNDIIHVDGNDHKSSGGTPQDAYGSVEAMMYAASELYIRSVAAWAKTHNVWLTHVHSNHDRTTGWSVSQMVARHFHNHPRVHAAFQSLDQRHRKYFVFGRNLLMFHHGEAKEERLLGVIKSEATEAFWQTDRIYCYQGHTHHKSVNKRGLNTENVEKDHSAVTVIKAGSGVQNQMYVETLRSPSPADDWHSRSLYANIPAVEVFLLNERNQFGRFTHEF